MAYALDLLFQALEMGLLAASLWLLIQHLGLVSLGHAAFYGLAGYVLALSAPHTGSALASALLGVLAASGFAALTGWFVLRSRGLAFLMATLAFAQMLLVLGQDTPYFGGSDGLYVDRLSPLNIEEKALSMTAVAAAGAALIWRIGRSPFGFLMAAAHQHEDRLTSLGYSVFQIQLTAYVLSASLAGAAGAMHALRFGFVSPSLFSWQVSGMALLMVLLGGQTYFFSPWLGALAVVLLHELLASHALWGDWARHWAAGLGLIMIILARRKTR
jgi:branched-chain amino acid transport system permease protein